MMPRATGVIKSGQVRAGDSLAAPLPGQAARGVASALAAGGLARARIVEQRPDGVIVEVTCTCGRTVLLQCDYA